MSDDDLIARFGSARRPERPPGHPVPDGVDDETVAALGELSAAFEVIEEARGYLYAFHRRSGTADLALQHAVDHLRQAGHHALADEIDQVLVGRDVLPGLWTYQIVETYDRTYYDVWKVAVEKAERVAGRRHTPPRRVRHEGRGAGQGTVDARNFSTVVGGGAE